MHEHVVSSGGEREQPLRVIIYLFFPAGGIGKYTHEVLQRVQAFPDVQCSLVCSPDYEWLSAADYRVLPILRSLQHTNPLRRRIRFLLGQHINPQRLLQECHRQRPDIIHFSNINHLTLPVWRSSLRRLGTAVAATVHDVRRGKAMISRRYEEAQLRSFYRFADHLFVHGEAQQEELRKFAGIRSCDTSIVPLGPFTHGPTRHTREEVRRRLGIPQDATVGLCFGQIRDDKNVGLLLAAAARSHERLHLIVAGRGGARGHKPVEFYKRLAVELSVEHRVLFLDRHIPDANVADLYAACNWASLYYSGAFTSQSGVLSTCINYRCPVIASDSGTLGEVVRQFDVGVAATPDDVEALASAIQSMEQQLAQGKSFAFEQYLQENSWEENARRTVAAYREVLKRRKCTSS